MRLSFPDIASSVSKIISRNSLPFPLSLFQPPSMPTPETHSTEYRPEHQPINREGLELALRRVAPIGYPSPGIFPVS